MNYEVHAVRDDELPEGTHAVIVEREGDLPLLLINGSPARAWAMVLAYEETHETPPRLVPRPRPIVQRQAFPRRAV